MAYCMPYQSNKMKAFQQHDLLKYYMTIMDHDMAIRIKTLWLVQNLPLGDLYKCMIKEFPELEVYLQGFIRRRVSHHCTEGSTLILTAMLFLNEADKAALWNKYQNSFEEKEKYDNMTLGEYHESLRANSPNLISRPSKSQFGKTVARERQNSERAAG
jgi:hypothetical protein